MSFELASDISRVAALLRQLCRPSQVIAELRRFDSHQQLTEHVQMLLLKSVLPPSFRNSDTNRSYKRRLFEQLMRAISQDGCGINDDLCDLFIEAELCAGNEAFSDKNWCEKTFSYSVKTTAAQSVDDIPQQHFITLRLLPDVICESSTGCIQWGAAFALAEYALNNEELVRGRACLELGCGSGLLGVVLSRLNAVCAVLTDGDSNALDNCRRNVAANNTTTCVDSGKSIGSACHVTCQQLLWEQDWSHVATPDVIVASDVIYNPDAFPALIAVLKELLARPLTSDRQTVGQTSAQSATPALPSADTGATCADSDPCVGDDASSSGKSDRSDTAPATQTQLHPVAYLSAQIRSPASLQTFKDMLTAQGLHWSILAWPSAHSRIQFDHLCLREDISQVVLMQIIASHSSF